MDVLFQSKKYLNFEKTPSARAEWGEDLVKHFFSSKGFLTFRTAEIDKIDVEFYVKDIIDALFKNKDSHSIDVISFFETNTEKEQRMRDEAFVSEIIKKRKPYDLGAFTKGRYSLDIFYNTSEGAPKMEIHLLPHIAFIEVKTYLKTSKPPIISPAELYRLLYWREKMGEGAIFLAIIEIDTPEKKAVVNFVFPEKFDNVNQKWYKFEEKQFVTARDESGYIRIRLPQVIERGKEPYTPILSFNLLENDVKFKAHTISFIVNIQTEEDKSVVQ